jgi:hypothetical protein
MVLIDVCVCVCVCVHLERAELTIVALKVFDLIQCAITDEFTSTQPHLFGLYGCLLRTYRKHSFKCLSLGRQLMIKQLLVSHTTHQRTKEMFGRPVWAASRSVPLDLANIHRGLRPSPAWLNPESSPSLKWFGIRRYGVSISLGGVRYFWTRTVY